MRRELPNQIITPDGTMTETAPKDGVLYHLEELQAVVGGLIELVRLPGAKPGDLDMLVVNEEGLLLELPFNPIASLLARRRLVGTVLLCSSHRIA